MAVDVLLGLQWGDEGKGKIVDYLAPRYHVVARFQGGPNAGHTLIINDEKVVLHTIPSGIFNDHVLNVIGNGVVIDPVTFQKEIEKVNSYGVNLKEKLLISRKAHLIMPTHKILDAASEAAKGKDKIGSTLKGIGPAYMDKTGRNGIRVGDIESPQFASQYQKLKEKHLRLLELYDYDYELEQLEEEWRAGIETLRSLTLVDSEYFINEYLSVQKPILAEGAQGSLLDIEFGTYPYVTSSNTISAGVCTGLGVAPKHIRGVIGVTKAYCTRVGSGPFPTQLDDEVGEKLRKQGGEFGATTGRPRRCGWLDLPALKYAIMLNGANQIALTKADVMSNFEEIKVCTHYLVDGKETHHLPYNMDSVEITPVYKTFAGWNSDLDGIKNMEDLPKNLNGYMEYLCQELVVDITLLSIGPKREELIRPMRPGILA